MDTTCRSIADTTNQLARIYADHGGDLAMALALAHAAAERAPDARQVDDTVGWILYKNGLTSLAVAALRRGVARDPGNPIPRRHLAMAYLRTGDIDHARASLEAAAALEPSAREVDVGTPEV